MIVATYDKITGRIGYAISAANLVVGDYETDEYGSVVVPTMPDLTRQGYFTLPVDPSMPDAYYVPIPGEAGYPNVGGDPIENYSWDWTTLEFFPDVPRATAAANERVKLGQDTMKFGNFTWGAFEFQGNSESQNQIRGYALEAYLAQVASAPFSVDWTLADNSTTTLDASDMLSVFAALQANVKAAQDQGNALRADIVTAAAIDPDVDAVEALNEIDWVAP